MKYSLISIFLSCIVISLAIWVNVSIAEDYLNAKGKTRALFGLIEMGYTYKYYFLIGSLASGILVWKASRNKENRKIRISAYLFLLLGILSVVLSTWRWFV